jgi:hypothetical protein
MPDDMYQRAYWDIQKLLDEYLGPKEEDGAGQGIVADVYLLAHRYELAIAALRAAGAGAVADAIRSQQLPDPFASVAGAAEAPQT